MTAFIKRAGEALKRNPNDIWRHIIMSAEDKSRRLEHYTTTAFVIPLAEKLTQSITSVLVLKNWLSGHVEFSIYDLVALAVVGHQRQISRSEFLGDSSI